MQSIGPDGLLVQGPLIVTGPGAINFTSDEVALPAASAILTINHGLAAAPRMMWAIMRCKTIDIGYAVGNQVPLYGGAHQVSGVYTLVATALVVGIARNANAWNLTNPTTFLQAAITDASWRLVFYAIL